MPNDDIRAILKESLAPLHREIKETKSLLTGNGDPEKGLVLKVDRIIQSEKQRKYWTRTMIGMVLASIITTVHNLFK